MLRMHYSQWKLIQTTNYNVLGPKVLVRPSRPVDESVPESVKRAKVITPPGRFMGVSRFRRAVWDPYHAHSAWNPQVWPLGATVMTVTKKVPKRRAVRLKDSKIAYFLACTED